MNKSILKHEFKSMKWMLILSILVSLFLTIMFGVTLDREYTIMFSSGIYGNKAPIIAALRDITDIILVIFTAISMVQIFMQFRSEKNQETGRFLKSLPVKKEEFFNIKLLTGLMNITIAFIVLGVGFIIVRNSNMFWIKDIHSISYATDIFTKADSIKSLLGELGLVYLVVLSFYTFLFMIQYTFSNIVGGIVTGTLVWLAPIFILMSLILTLSKLGIVDYYTSNITNSMDNLSVWFLPWAYVFDIDHNIWSPAGIDLGSIGIISKLGLKYIITLVLTLINILVAYRFNKKSKIEDENKIIPFKSTQNIFKFGVTICSALLISILLTVVMKIDIPNIIYIVFILLGGLIGYIVSRKITKIGNI